MSTTGATEILRYTAFSDDPAGGNPAGVVLDATGLDAPAMQRIAAGVGYSETAFLLPGADPRAPAIRYFSPLAEVPFCGHATIATAVAHADRFGPGRLVLATAAGEVVVLTSHGPGGMSATLTSVAPSVADIDVEARAALLGALRVDESDVDADLPIRVAFAGAHHPIVALATRARLAALDYDFGALSAAMATWRWTTIAVVHRESAALFHARNPFPPGGIVEDPATGAAAAALGAYLRSQLLVDPPAAITVRQGQDMGRPSLLHVGIPRRGGIHVTGAAVPLP
ncbi:MAG: phenazine biosynthesis protein PhzF family [Pseudonocardiales bacterium]|nr:phenazine biosynthesis protein PhzF family [Jatrophihabitantaceae bacterium]MCW2604540.1 phenazine biosynthesis protein PhzF family [Pseudonocardiales bacterium]